MIGVHDDHDEPKKEIEKRGGQSQSRQKKHSLDVAETDDDVDDGS